MVCKDIISLVALFALAAAIGPEAKHPPHHKGHYHHNAAPIHHTPEVAPSNSFLEQPLAAQEKIENQNITETEDEIDDIALVASIGLKGFLERESIPAKCDALSLPMYSCYNCYSYLVCKPEGGKIKACKDPYAPYCNNGICSQVPSEACSNL